VMGALSLVSRINFFNFIIKSNLKVVDSSLIVKIGELTFANPVGLAAGFDKNISAPLAYSMLGFGFAELGSLTYEPQTGNKKPRLWRLPKDKSLIVYYGLANKGIKSAVDKIKNFKTSNFPFGVSIAPTTGLSIDQMSDDYLRSFEAIFPYADYVTLNVSCPNVANCDLFTQVDFIKDLIKKVNNLKNKLNSTVDIFLKIGPDMTILQYDEIVDSCIESGISAMIVTNLIKDRTNLKSASLSQDLNHPGGISGYLLKNKSTEIIKHIYKRSNGRLKIIGVGGVFNAKDAYEKIRSGASAVQLITGFIYNGPAAIANINRGLVDLLKKDNFKNISEAVGVDVC